MKNPNNLKKNVLEATFNHQQALNKFNQYIKIRLLQLVFNQIKTLFMPDRYKLIVIPSYRTPEEIIKKAHNTFSHNHLVIKKIDNSNSQSQ